MCARTPAEPASDAYFFDPVIKCCTYVPYLYNFLVGRILCDSEPAAQYGRASVEKRVAEAVGVTPLGLAPDAVTSLLYGRMEQAFGRNRAVRCPHFVEDGGRCGIWRHRNSTCVTWFCKHVRGEVGYAFWRESLHPLLLAVEKDLARWCVMELDPTMEVLRHLVEAGEWRYEQDDTLTREALDQRVDAKAYARVWGKWRGRELEYYRRCGELVSALGWAEALARCGSEARGYAQLAREAFVRLNSTDIPAALKVGSFRVVRMEGAMTRVESYSRYDPLDVPNDLMELLQFFDGRSTADALKAIAAERHVSVDPALVRKLVDFKLLVPREG